MNDLEYEKVIYQIVQSGKGQRAIRDILQAIYKEKSETEKELYELQAERRAIAMVFDKMQGSYKAKLYAVRRYFIKDEEQPHRKGTHKEYEG